MTDDTDLQAEKNALQDLIWRGAEPLEPILDRAMRVVVAASQPEHAADPARPCVHEDLLLVHQMMDFPGYAEKIDSIASTFAGEIPTSSQCHFCMAFLAVQAKVVRGQLDDAAAEAHRAIADLPNDDSFATECRRLDLVTALCEVDHARGDADALRARLPAFDEYGAAMRMFNPALAAWGTLCAMFLADLEDRVDDLAGQLETIEGLCDLAQDVSLRAARLCVDGYRRSGRHEEALALAERAAAAAEARDAHRFAAELRLAAAESTKALGRDPSAHLDALRRVLPRLKSTDLQARADSL